MKRLSIIALRFPWIVTASAGESPLLVALCDFLLVFPGGGAFSICLRIPESAVRFDFVSSLLLASIVVVRSTFLPLKEDLTPFLPFRRPSCAPCPPTISCTASTRSLARLMSLSPSSSAPLRVLQHQALRYDLKPLSPSAWLPVEPRQRNKSTPPPTYASRTQRRGGSCCELERLGSNRGRGPGEAREAA